MRVEYRVKSANPSFKAIRLVSVIGRDEKNFAKAFISGFDSAAAFERALKDKGVSDTFVHSIFRKKTGATEIYVLSAEDAEPIKKLDKRIVALTKRFEAGMTSDRFVIKFDALINKIKEKQKAIATGIIENKRANS